MTKRYTADVPLSVDFLVHPPDPKAGIMKHRIEINGFDENDGWPWTVIGAYLCDNWRDIVAEIEEDPCI